MKGYVVCVYKSITNEDKLKEYAVKARAAVEKYKGKFLIRGGKTTTNEGEASPLATNRPDQQCCNVKADGEQCETASLDRKSGLRRCSECSRD